MKSPDAMQHGFGIRTATTIQGLSAAALLLFLLFGFLNVAVAGAQALATTDQEMEQGREQKIHALDAGEEVSFLEHKASLELRRASFEEVLWAIAREGGLGLSYNPDLIPEQEVTLRIEEKTLADALQQLLASTDLEALITSNREIVLVEQTSAEQGQISPEDQEQESSERGEVGGFDLNARSVLAAIRPAQRAQQQTVEGQVTDAESGEPLPGVNVLVQNTDIGTTTGVDGAYSIEIPEDVPQVLVFSFVGYETQEVSIEGRERIDVELVPEEVALEEVVVIGYGEAARQDVTGSISSVTSADIGDIPVASFEEAMQGQISGVQIDQRTGEPGAAPEIQVRGTGTLTAGTDPVFVIDGIPVDKNLALQGELNQRRDAFSTPRQNPLSNIHPRDIESIEVLKDASAASIYGSRGSNGVVMVSTKEGGGIDGRPVVNFSQRVGVSEVANRPDMMNAEEWIEFMFDSRNNNYRDKYGEEPPNPRTNEGRPEDDDFVIIPERAIQFDQGEIDTDYDYLEGVYERGAESETYLSLSGGVEDISYFLSGSYLTEKGTIDRTGFERYSLRANLRGDITDYIHFGTNLSLSRSDQDRLPTSAPYFATPPGIPYSAQVHIPIVKPFNEDGTPNELNGQSFLGGGTTTASNPFQIQQSFDWTLVHDRVQSMAFLEFDLTDEVVFNTRGAIDYSQYDQEFFQSTEFLFRGSDTEPFAQDNSSNSFNWLSENTLEYQDVIGDHSVTGLVGFTAQQQTDAQSAIFATDFIDDRVQTINAGVVTGGTSLREQWALTSWLARGTWNYQDRYLATASIRADQSSRFGPGNRTGVFPSGSFGWRISEENFMEDVSSVSELRIRVAVGQTGNFLIPNFGSYSLLGESDYPTGEERSVGLAQSTVGDEDLSWETTTEFNLGLDVGLFNDRIEFFGEYYYAQTEDLLLNVEVPAQTGFTTVLTNIGSVLNEGIEFELTTHNITGEFSWTTDFNFSTNRNEVLSLGPDDAPIRSTGAAGIRHITMVGHEIGSYYGYVTDGIYQSEEEIANAPEDEEAPDPRPGDIRFKDVDGDGRITADDRTITGSYHPDWTVGMRNQFQWQGFNLSFFLDAIVGRDILNLTARHMKNGEANFNSYSVFNDRWRSPDESGDGKTPRADRQTGLHGNNNRPSDFQVEDASSLRLRNLSLGYTFNFEAGGVTRQARVYFAGRNLVTITPYINFNPDVSLQNSPLVRGEDYGAYPISRDLTIGFDLTF